MLENIKQKDAKIFWKHKKMMADRVVTNGKFRSSEPLVVGH